MNYIILYLRGASVVKFWSSDSISDAALKALGDLKDTDGEFRQALVEMLGRIDVYSERAITIIASASCRPESCLDASLVLLAF